MLYSKKSIQLKAKNMRTTLTLFCILGASLAGFSQDKSFDLSNYKFPDYKRHELEFNLNSSGNSYKSSQFNPSIPGSDYITKSQINSNSTFSLNYEFDYLTRKRIDFLYSSFSGQFAYEKQNNSGVQTKQINPNLDFEIKGSRKYYPKGDNKLFFEVAPDLTYKFDQTKNTYDGKVNENWRNGNLDLLVDIGLGLGRMEKVSDLWQAYYILEKLSQQKSLSRDLNVNDIFEFASFTSKLKNKRFFDARLRKIAELQGLDSLLHQKGLIVNSDVTYFATMNDYWFFTNFQNRESGKVFKFLLSPQYSRYYYKSYGNNSQISNNTNLVSTLSFNCTKQLNLFWERHLNVTISNRTLLDNSEPLPDNYPKSHFNSQLIFGYTFYPNTRTSLSASATYYGIDETYETNYTNNEYTYTRNWSNQIYFNVNGIYYLSPQLQITGNIVCGYIDKYYFNKNYSSFNYNLGLRYAIF
jgi:hypothetical protein